MKIEQVELEETECFSSIFIDYIKEKAPLKNFYNLFPSTDNFGKLIEGRSFSDSKRALLVDVLSRQYGPLDIAEITDFNIHSLSNPKTFTVTTGHQLTIITGPLYFIYKIVTVINACKTLKAQYPDYHFVPVYWMASEDHDLEEISYFHLFGKKYHWETDQKGAVGRMKPHSLNNVIDKLPENVPLFEKAYLDHDTLADAVRFYVNELFGDEGLVVVDADDLKLKELFAPIMERELFDNTSHQLVAQRSAELEGAGYKTQAFSREINFFYMENGLRQRIEKDDKGFKVLNTNTHFTEQEMNILIQESPNSLSPNVIMRPLYQETILPNLAYCGGPAEIAYWIQLKSTFDHYDTPFPALLPRAFGMVINKPIEKKIEKLKLSNVDLFKSIHALKETYLEKHSENDFGLEEEISELNALFEKIRIKAEEIDSSLSGYVGAERAKASKHLENIAKRLKKAEEQNNETALAQIDAIKDKLFPENSLQERHDNYLNFQLNNPEFINDLLAELDAFDFRFHILRDT